MNKKAEIILQKICLPLLMVIIFTACSGSDPKKADPTSKNPDKTRAKESQNSQPSARGKNLPPQMVSANLSPEKATLLDRISVTAQANDADGHSVTYSYKWFVNDQLLPNEFESGIQRAYIKGDSVFAVVTPSDENGEGQSLRTKTITIQNAKPQVEITGYTPEHPGKNTGLEIQTKIEDPDGDVLDIDYIWTQDLKIREDLKESKLSGDLLKKKTWLKVRVHVSDTIDTVSVESDNIPISNSPPTITSNPPELKDKVQTYSYKVIAEDPDGDKIKFEMEGPKGATISSDGELRWTPARDQEGLNKIKVTASDDENAKGFQEFELTVRFPKGDTVKPAPSP